MDSIDLRVRNDLDLLHERQVERDLAVINFPNLDRRNEVDILGIIGGQGVEGHIFIDQCSIIVCVVIVLLHSRRQDR